MKSTSISEIHAIETWLNLAEQEQTTPEHTLNYAQQALRLAETHHLPEAQIRAMQSICKAYTQLSRFQDALECGLKLLQFKTDLPDQMQFARALLLVGSVYMELGKQADALDLLNQSLEVWRKLQDQPGIAKALNCIGIARRRLNQYDLALEAYQHALDIRHALHDTEGIFDTHNNLGSIYVALNRYDQALAHYLAALHIDETLIPAYSRGKLLNNIGYIYTQLGDYNLASSYLMQGLAIGEHLKAKSIQQHAYENLAELYAAQNDYQQAYHYHKQFSKVKEEVLNLEIQQKVAEIQSRYESEVQAKELEVYRVKNDELMHLNQHLQDLNREKNEFLSMATHDLKNPLTSILLMIETWIEFGVDITRDEAKQSLKWLRNMIMDMLNIVINILDINSIEAGELNLHMQNFDVASRLESLVENYDQMADAKQIKLIVRIPSAKVMLYADPSAMTQVLDNLVSNAIKYSPIQRNIYIHLLETPQAVRFEVRDEGQGLTDIDKTKLFTKFARLSARPTGGEHTTGLGLSIVKKLVEAMKGNVWAESDGKNKGAAFIVEFPRVTDVSTI